MNPESHHESFNNMIDFIQEKIDFMIEKEDQIKTDPGFEEPEQYLKMTEICNYVFEFYKDEKWYEICSVMKTIIEDNTDKFNKTQKILAELVSVNIYYSIVKNGTQNPTETEDTINMIKPKIKEIWDKFILNIHNQ